MNEKPTYEAEVISMRAEKSDFATVITGEFVIQTGPLDPSDLIKLLSELYTDCSARYEPRSNRHELIFTSKRDSQTGNQQSVLVDLDIDWDTVPAS